MAEHTIITSNRNPRVVNARKLAQRKHRTRQGRFLVQGQQLLWMALDAGYTVEEVFTAPGTTPEQEDTRALLDRLQESGTTVIEVSPEIQASLISRDDPQTLAGVVQQRALSLREVRLPPNPLILVLDRLQDCGNVGTLIRTADAAGAAAVVLLEPTADPYDPRAVRSSMGSLFNLPVISVPDMDALTPWLRANALRVIAADAHQGTLWGRELLRAARRCAWVTKPGDYPPRPALPSTPGFACRCSGKRTRSM